MTHRAMAHHLQLHWLFKLAYSPAYPLRYNHMPATVHDIDACLPQTQCGRCSYPRCEDYARAIVTGETINRCPPGQDTTIELLAQLLEVDTIELDPQLPAYDNRVLAVIDEDLCIGCTLCIQACPVDAIIGSNKRMHTVIANECTGCELCLPPCPMDCIRLEPWHGNADKLSPWPEYSTADREHSRRRVKAHDKRLMAMQQQKTVTVKTAQQDKMRDEIAAAVARVKARRQDG